MLTRVLIIGLAVLWTAGSVASQSIIQLAPYAGKHKQVRVTIAGTEQRFLFDTGGGYTLISPQLARLIGCAPSGRVAGFRNTGARFDTAICPNVRLALGPLPPHAETVGVFDLMALLPKELPALDGVISLASLRERSIALDLAGGRVTVGAQIKGTFFSCRAATGLDGSNYVLFAAVDRAGSEFWFEVDSGNLDAVLVAPHVAGQFGLDPVSKEAKEVDLSLGRSPPSRVAARVADIIYDGVISAQFLETGTLSADLSGTPVCRWQPHQATPKDTR